MRSKRNGWPILRLAWIFPFPFLWVTSIDLEPTHRPGGGLCPPGVTARSETLTLGEVPRGEPRLARDLDRDRASLRMTPARACVLPAGAALPRP